MHSRLIRWLPAVIAPVVIAGAIALPLTAAAAPSLHAKTPKQVLQLVEKAKTVHGFSGEISQTSALGLPELPTTGAGTDSTTASALQLLTGDHEARISVSGATKSRVAVLDSMGERDLIRDGRSVWGWDSSTSTATHVVVPATASHPRSSTLPTPGELADEMLATARSSTRVAVGTPLRVADRDAYTLVLTPRTTATTVGSIQISVDAETGLPLRVAIFARGTSAPAFETAFTSIDYTVPAASTFVFTPPSGAKVVAENPVAPRKVEQPDVAHGRMLPGSTPAVTGSGWASVVEVPAAEVPKDLTSNPTFTRLTTQVSGGRVLSTALVNVLLTTDGRVFAGAVPVSRLQAAATAG